MATYEIAQDGDGGATIELAQVGAAQQELLAAFGECASGRCSCPTAEYEKVAAMEVEASQDGIAIRLEVQPGTGLDVDQVAACLDHTIAGTSP